MKRINMKCNSFDFLSPEPSLYIKSKQRYVTPTGIVFSVLFFFSFFTIFFIFLADFIKGTGMTLIYSKEEISQDLSFKLNKKLLAFDFVSIDKGEVDSRIASIFPVLWSYNGNIGTITEIPIEVCSYEKHFPERQYGQHFNTINISDFLCLSNDNIDLSLVFNKSNWSGSYIILYTRTCTNTTENNNHCYPQEEIDKAMSNTTYYFSHA